MSNSVRALSTATCGSTYDGDVCERKSGHRGKHRHTHPTMTVEWAEIKLTPAQRTFLENADECTPPNERAVRFDWSGIGVKGSTIRTAHRLSALGLVEYIDHGRVEDDDNGDAERPIYAITERGRKLLAKRAGGAR